MAASGSDTVEDNVVYMDLDEGWTDEGGMEFAIDVEPFELPKVREISNYIR